MGEITVTHVLPGGRVAALDKQMLIRASAAAAGGIRLGANIVTVSDLLQPDEKRSLAWQQTDQMSGLQRVVGF